MDDRAAEWSATGEGVGRNTGFALATQLTTSLFTAALTVFLVRALGPHGYGVFALALTSRTFLSWLSRGDYIRTELEVTEIGHGDGSAAVHR